MATSIFRKFQRRKRSTGAYDAFCKDYIMTDVILGTGSYAEVRMGKRRRNNENVAVKIVDKSNLSPRELKGLHKEVSILKSINHKNVVKLYDFYEEDDIMYVVMEYVGGGELFDRIVDNDPPLNEDDIRKMMRTLALALRHCKEKGVIHRDIKPQNLLLTKKDEGAELKLADFNLSVQLDPKSIEFNVVQTMCGTPNYVAPEVLSGKPYDFKCDIWSLGVICFVVLSGGCLPFFVEEDGEYGKQRLLRKVMKGNWSFYPADAWETVSEEAKDFLRKVMQRKPENRLDYDGILSHPWIADLETSFGQELNLSKLQKNESQRQIESAAIVLRAVGIFKQAMGSEEAEEGPNVFEEEDF